MIGGFSRGMKRGGVSAVVAGLLAFCAESAAQSGMISDDRGNPVSISVDPFQPRAGTDDIPFSRYDGTEFGLDQPNPLSPKDFYPPFFNGGGIASGDIDRDGWPDLASADVALVDINGDGWLDIFGTTYLHGNFYLLNESGAYTSAGLRQLPAGRSVLGSTASFGDVDRDGDLDAVIGNWFAGASKKHPPPHSQNELWINEGDHFETSPLVELVGETLSSLLSDWNGDGWLDLIVGNDFDEPDFFYRGDARGGFELIERRDGIVPVSTHSTMSIDTGDFDNDLDLDVFIDQITARATGPSARMQIFALEKYCDDIVIPADRDRCRANMATRQGFFYGANHRPTNVRNCNEVPDETDRRECIGMQVMMTAQRLRKPDICDAIPEAETRTYLLCRNFFEPIFHHDPEMLRQAIPQRMNENVLLAWDASEGRFTDVTGQAGVQFTGWSWNARFADVDNDEWQDIYIVAGSWFRATPSGTTANFFFHNEAGERFSDQTDAFGLQNMMIVSAYTVVDFDRDGDLDFVTNSINGPLWLLRNNTDKGHSIAFQIQDEIGNRDGIGTKIIIHYGSGGERHQLRELKASGGYLSFDEPLAHFGLGDYERVERVEISWSTGDTTTIPGPLDAGHIYTLKRSANVTPTPQL